MIKQSNKNLPVVLMNKAVVHSATFKGIIEQAAEFGWRVLDLDISGSVTPAKCKLIGAIISVPYDHDEAKWALNFDCPIVRVGFQSNPLDQKVPAVITDLQGIGRIAAEHFRERNFRHVGYIANKPWATTGKELYYDIFRQRAEELECSCHLLSFQSFLAETSDRRYKRLFSEVKNWLSEIPKPVGIFAQTEAVAARLASICHSIGVSVPEDVGILVVGDSSQLCEIALTPVSSIDVGALQQGKEAIRLLHRIVRGDKLQKMPIVIPPIGVVERRSTDVLAVPDPLVARALSYVWNNLELDLSVSEISSHLGVSRSILDRAFKRHLGRGINAERLRKRLERSTEMLRGTDLTIEEIAKSVGFPYVSYFHRYFNSKFGMTPREYRLGKSQDKIPRISKVRNI
jgi:LacI family transcriptional regulator